MQLKNSTKSNKKYKVRFSNYSEFFYAFSCFWCVVFGAVVWDTWKEPLFMWKDVQCYLRNKFPLCCVQKNSIEAWNSWWIALGKSYICQKGIEKLRKSIPRTFHLFFLSWKWVFLPSSLKSSSINCGANEFKPGFPSYNNYTELPTS